MDQQTNSSPPPGDDDQHLNPVNQSAADDVTFAFNHLQLNPNDDSTSHELTPDSPETDDDDDDDDEEDGDFTFMCVGDNDSPTTTEDGGKIRMVFPLFDQSLLSGGDSDDDGKHRFPIDVPVDKVFIESPQSSLTLSKVNESGSTEMNMKSNSTGFSKLWRFRNEMNRSNSDSRDAFVFLDNKATASEVNGGKGEAVKKGLGLDKKNKKKKTAGSAHEVYLKQKGGQTEEERRRSYLPYRPGLMGFFTNVNGGLSKNVHPF